jgi:hypothetical protein
MEIEDGATCDRPLLVKLTEEELIIRGASMADAELQIEQLKDRRKLLNSEITTQVHLRAQLAHVIEEGFESRDVRCKWIGDFPSNQWKLIRQDNGEEVETRTMSGADRQREMEFDPGDGDVEDERLVEDEDGAPLPPESQRAAAPKRKRARKATKAAAKGGKSKSSKSVKGKAKPNRKAA